MEEKKENLYALDFDGVLCDSCGESSLSAVKAAKIRWPSLFEDVDSALEAWIVDQMHVVRPVVETGYENLLLVRLLLEIQMPTIRKSSVAAGLTVEGILDNWSKLKPVIMEEWNEEKDSLIELFGKVRDEWIDMDLPSWIGANRISARSVIRQTIAYICCNWLLNHGIHGMVTTYHTNSGTKFWAVWTSCTDSKGDCSHTDVSRGLRLYPGVSDALKFACSRVYIVTTKQGRFADALLRELAGVTIPSDRIYGLGTGPKVEVLKQLQRKPEHQGLTFHFVEDRLATLKNVIKEPELDAWNLYLGDWGYNTQKEREEAASIPRIQMLELSDFTAGTAIGCI